MGRDEYSMDNTMIDTNQILSNVTVNVVNNVLSETWSRVSQYFKDLKEEDSIEMRTAYNEYICVTNGKISKIKTLIYRRVPKNIYSFYESTSLLLEDKIIETNNINNLLKIGRKILITGTGGIGKSMLMKHLFLNTFKETNYIPILLELRKFNSIDNKEISIYQAIYKVLVDNGFRLTDKYYKYSLEKGAYIIFLDGFDEINRDKLSKVQDEIKDFSDKFSQNRFIISSRPSEWFIGWNDFIEAMVRPLTKKQALSLISKIDFEESAKSAFYTELDRRLYNRYKSFASNPLLLTIMLLTFSNHAAIPENLNEFYEEAFTTLFNMHDATKDCYLRDIRSKLGCEEFKSVFSYICFKTYFKQQFEFSNHDLKCRIKEAQEKFKNYTFDIDDFQEDLTLSVCMLVKNGIDYQFSHRSFQEYFAAVYTCKLTDDIQCKLLTSWLGEFYSVISDGYISMLYGLQPDKVNKVVFSPGLKKLKELYCLEGFSISLLGRLFSKLVLKMKSIPVKQGREEFYDINFGIKDKYLCNILRATCKLNKYKYKNRDSKVALEFIDEIKRWNNINKDKHIENKRYIVIDMDSITKILKEKPIYEKSLLESALWIKDQLDFCVSILEEYSKKSISHKKKVASIINEL